MPISTIFEPIIINTRKGAEILIKELEKGEVCNSTEDKYTDNPRVIREIKKKKMMRE